MLLVKLWKLKIWNKDAITKEIIVVLNWFIHISLYSGGVHVKQSFLICNTFQAAYVDSVIMYHMLQSFVLQNSSRNFKNTKHENVTHFINAKGWKASASGKLIGY